MKYVIYGLAGIGALCVVSWVVIAIWYWRTRPWWEEDADI